MANKKIQATATLFLDTKDAQNDAKRFVSDLKQKLSDIETAADKMTVFKDMVAYIAQVDRALAALRKNNKDAFNSMFDGLDVNLKQQLEGLFGVNGAQLGQVDALREKLNTLTLKSSIKEIRTFAKEINTLFTSIGVSAPFDNIDEQFSGRTNTGHIQALATALANFATVWEDLSANIAKGLGIGGQDAGISGGLANQNKEIKEEIDKLKKQREEYQELIDAFSGKNIKVQTNKKTDVAQLQELINKFNEAQAAVQQFENANNTSGDAYKKAVAEAFKMATLLKNTMDYVAEYGSDEGNLFVSSQTGKNGSYSLAEKYIKDIKKANIFNDVQTYFNQQILAIDAQVNKLQNPTNNAVSLYDELNQKAQEYLELRKQINATDRNKDPQEYKRLIDRKNEVALEIEQLKELSEDDTDALYDVFEEADADGAKLNEIVEKFCNVLQIEIPQAATTASSATGSAFTKITQGANEASEAVQNVMYHLGNLLNGQGKPRDTFGDMAENLTAAAVGTRWEQYGFGALGGGLFGVSNPSTITQNPGTSTFIQSIDLSKYNMYMANTEERATALIDFLSKLQKFSMKSAEPNYTGFDAQLQGLDIDALYGQAKLVFDQAELTKDQFEDFIDEMVAMLKLTGLAFDAQTGELSFTNLTSEIANSENISTRFMKLLGYHGVNVGGTSFDGLGQGSVLFDFDKLDIVGYFNTIQEAVDDYQKIINQIDGGSWVGSIEQLQQYANNIDGIINKITEAKNSGKLSGEAGVDETLNKLTQIRQNIGDILSGKVVSGNNPFVTITTGSAEAGKAIDQAKTKVESFLEMADKAQHENLYGSAENNVDIGKYLERLETAKTELEALGAQGLITAEDLEKVNLAFTEATVHLEAETSYYDSYYSGSSYDYYDDYKQEQSKNGDLENELTRKEERIAELESDLRASDDALQETLGNKYALIAESRTLEIERAELLLQKQSLEYEDILALMQSYQNLQAKAKEAFDYGDEKAMHDMQELAGQIYDRVVPQNLDDFTEPDRWFKAVGMSAEEGAQKLLEFRERLEAVRDAHEDLELSDSEDIGDLQRENGTLQDKLDLLNEIASVYGSNITQKDRSRYEELTYKEMESGLTSKEEDRLSDLSDNVYEADSALEEFGNTYDKIILKLANGKKVEILPDDAGLRALHKFEDEGYGETYGGVDVEDVVFVRKQEQSVIEQTNQELQEHLNLQKQINQESKKDIHVDTMGQEPVADDVSSYLVESQEIAQLEVLQQKLLEVKAAVDAKTQAFEEEFATVNNVVDSEIMALQSLIEQLQEVVAQINLINAGFNSINTNAPKIEQDQRPKTEQESTNIISQKTQVETAPDTNAQEEINQLNQLKAVLGEVQNAIAAKTKAFVDEGNVVGQTVGKEISALMKLSETVDGIVPKVNSLVDGIKNLKNQGIDIKDNGATKTGSDDAKTTGGTKDAPPQDPFKSAFRNQKNAFNEYRKNLQDVDYLTDNLRTELDGLGVSLNQVTDQPGLDAWIKSFNVLQSSVKEVQSEFAQMNNSKINLYQKELSGAFNKLTLPQKEDLFEKYTKAIILLNQQKQAVKDGHAVELAGIKQITAALQEKIDAQIQANKAAKDAEKTQKKNANFGSTASINATAKYNSLSKVAGSDQFASSSEVAKVFDKYTQAYQNMITMRDRRRNSDDISDDDKEEFKTLTTECNNYAKSLEKLINTTLKLKSTKANQDDYMLGSDFDYSDVESRKAALADFAKQMYGVDVAATDFKDNWNKVVFAVDNGDGTFTQMTATFTDARNEIVAMAGDTKKAQSALANFWDELKGKFKSIGAYLVASFSFHEVWQVIRQGVTYVTEIDSALTELKKVTDETDASYRNFLQDMSQTGAVIGATVADLTTMASEWARLGYSMEEAGKLAESTAILLNVSEFDDATEASEALISTMQAFQYTADESQHVVDILNEVGNNYAVSSDGIATALQDSASALMEAGNNLEQSVALVAAAMKNWLFI